MTFWGFALYCSTCADFIAVMALVIHFCAIILAIYCPFNLFFLFTKSFEYGMYDMHSIQSLVNKLRYEISLVLYDTGIVLQ